MTDEDSESGRYGLTRRSVLKATGSTAVVSGVLAGNVAADNPHFVRNSASLGGKGELKVSMKVAGLGKEELYFVRVQGENICVTDVCINGGGKNPSAANKRSKEVDIEATEGVQSGKNGQLTTTITVPTPETDLDCPPGQREVTACVLYNQSITTSVWRDDGDRTFDPDSDELIVGPETPSNVPLRYEDNKFGDECEC